MFNLLLSLFEIVGSLLCIGLSGWLTSMVSPSRFCCGAETLTNFLGLLVIGTLGSLTVPLLVRKVKSGVSDAIISTGELTKLSACSLAGASLSYDETNLLGA